MACCQDKDCQCSGNNSSFVFGLIIGAFLAAAIIILTSKDKDKIIKNIREKIEKLFKDKAPEIKKKIAVIIPKDLTPPPVAPSPKKPVKLFKNPKK
jgi:signal transduction histidine kinase